MRRRSYQLGDTVTGMASYIGPIVGGDLYQWHDAYWLHLTPDSAVLEEIHGLPVPFITDELTRILTGMYARAGTKVPAFGPTGAIRRDAVTDSGTGTVTGLPFVQAGILPATAAEAAALVQVPPPASLPPGTTIDKTGTLTLPNGQVLTLPSWWPYAAAGLVGLLLLTR